MRVIGTAGHVDHGKSTLVKALTGIDPDRLKEEKEREMTIDLGFAWLTLPSGEQVGVVDVPGHQDFIKNMLAGVGGIEAALFIVAADESVMPQTREHLAILDLLQVPTGVIALTKIDLAESQDWIELVQAEVMEVVEGSVLDGTPIVPVSAVTGQGLDELLQTLDRVLAATSPRADRGRPRLPVDRVFTVAGFGTVVTGTLSDGSLRIGQEVEILPAGIRARIRGLQTHKHKLEVAVPGSRVAINLTGVSTDELKRGDVVTIPGWLEPTQLVDVRLNYLADAPRELRHNQEVEFFSGAAEVMAHVRLLGNQSLSPGQSGWVQLRLAERVPLVKGDRFIIRQPSPSLTIGGGVIVDPLPRRRHRRFRPDVIQRLERLAHGTPGDLLLETLDQRGPIPVRKLIAEATIPAETAATALHQLLQEGQVFFLSPAAANPDQSAQSLASNSQFVTSAAGWATLLGRLTGEVTRFHSAHPLRQGIPREALKSRLKLETRFFNEAMARAAAQGALVEHENIVQLPGHTVRFSPEQQQAINHLLREFQRAPYVTPSFKDCVSAVGEDVVLALIETGQLVRLSPDVLLLADTYRELVTWVREYIAKHGSVNVAQVRDAFNTSRKYALALLEYLDDQRITKRVGDDRVLRQTGGAG
ncbi:MAG: selenocysteine-specific translation elongation factor [Anaerolineae bacterium]